MYKEDKITLKLLHEKGLTEEKSIKALRSRAKDKILVLIGEEGRTRLYDKQLSVVRDKASKICRRHHTSITWGTLKRVFTKLDHNDPALNDTIIDLLNNSHNEEEVVQEVSDIIRNQLQNDGYIT